MSSKELLEDSLLDPPIGQTIGFEWYATPIGIAALRKGSASLNPEELYQNAIKEGLQIGLELTKEEKEFYFSSKGTVVIFYS